MADISPAAGITAHACDSMMVVNTNGSRFGRALCADLADHCSHLIVVEGGVSRGNNKLQMLLHAKNMRYELPIWDFSSQEVIDAQVRSVGKLNGRLDTFIFILPEMSNNSLKSLTLNEWQHTTDVLKTMFWCYRAVAKLMAGQRHGTMIGICFGVSARGDGEMLTWTVAGEALLGMSKCLAQELMDKDIRVNTIGYGYIKEVKYTFQAHFRLKTFSKFLGVKRQGTASDVAALIGLLASQHGSYITGQTLYVNGGLLI